MYIATQDVVAWVFETIIFSFATGNVGGSAVGSTIILLLAMWGRKNRENAA